MPVSGSRFLVYSDAANLIFYNYYTRSAVPIALIAAPQSASEAYNPWISHVHQFLARLSMFSVSTLNDAQLLH